MAGEHGLQVAMEVWEIGSFDVVFRSAEVEGMCTYVHSPQGARSWNDCQLRRGATYSSWSRLQINLAGEPVSGSLPALPTEMAVQVFDEAGREILAETHRPEYVEHYPNGRECDPEPFRSATVTLKVPNIPRD